MKSMVLASLGVALMTIVSAGCAYTPPAQHNMTMSSADRGTMSACMSMSKEDRMKTASCTSTMTKMKMSETDMSTMMACHKMTNDAMMKDQTCASMAKMHPDMMKMSMSGHAPVAEPQ